MNFSNYYKLTGWIVAVFICLFTYAALSKLFGFRMFEFTLCSSPLINPFSSILAWALPAIELITAILLFLPSTRLAGLYLSFALMVLFTGYIGYMLLYSAHLPCSCGGILRRLSWKEHLILNCSLTVLAAIGTVLEIKRIRSLQLVIHI